MIPASCAQLKRALYPWLLPIARDWWTRLGRETPGTAGQPRRSGMACP